MATGFDTTVNCAGKAAQIKAAGFDFVGRYLSQSSWKVVTKAEADSLLAAGVSIVLVYENNSTSASYFSNGQGLEDGTRAAQQALLLGAQAGTTIYFAVDYDALDEDLAGSITPYFQGALNAILAFAAANNPRYQVGIYGSGVSCSTIVGAGLAQQSWLAQSTGWRGFGTYVSWSIKQGPSTTALGMSIDSDSALDNYGAMQP